MRIIKAYDQNKVGCYFKNNEIGIEEFKSFLEYANNYDKITYQIIEMSEEEYNKLPEFEGW